MRGERSQRGERGGERRGEKEERRGEKEEQDMGERGKRREIVSSGKVGEGK